MTKASKNKDFFIRKNLEENQITILILKFFLYNNNITKSKRFKVMLKMQQLFKYSSEKNPVLGEAFLGNRFINRCMFSKKVRSVSRISNMSKASFKNYINWGKLNGFRKSSW